MKLSDLNFAHLRYFHAVAHEGSVLQASRLLHLAPSTVSGQIKTLEEQLGQALLQRSGRSVVLTPFGETVLGYADLIFETGEELVRIAAHGEARRPVRVGVSRVLPKLLVREVLKPAMMPDVQIMLEDGTSSHLLGQLAARRLDVVLSDAEMPSWMAVRGTSHLVVETDIAVFGVEELYDKVGDRLPDGLDDVPWIVPPGDTSLRHALEAWWEEVGLSPDIAAVVSDSALLKALAADGFGVFAAPARMMEALLEAYPVLCIGTTDRVRERAWAITVDTDPAEPAVRAIRGLPPR